MPKHSAPKIGLVYWNTGFGVGRDVAIVGDLLTNLGFRPIHIPTRVRDDVRERRFKFIQQSWRLLFPLPLQIHFEQIHREQFRFARKNVIVPNPEFSDPAVLPRVPNLSVISCKTRHACDLFLQHHPACEYNGFTSIDRKLEGVPKDFRRFLHVAGKSDYKGTDQVIEAWRRHPEWPELTVVWSPVCTYGGPRRALDAPRNVNVVSRFLDDRELLELQNGCGIHLCPSETEGFGHYINEALSTGAVVVTTDAPPMNEFVSDDHGFAVPAVPGSTQFMSTLYRVRVDALEAAVDTILRMPPASLLAMSVRARTVFEEGRASFHRRFGDMIGRLMAKRSEVPNSPVG